MNDENKAGYQKIKNNTKEKEKNNNSESESKNHYCALMIFKR